MSNKSCPVTRVVEIRVVICAPAPAGLPRRSVVAPVTLNGLLIPKLLLVAFVISFVTVVVVATLHVPGSYAYNNVILVVLLAVH